MTSLVEVYWNICGAFLGRCIGYLVDKLPLAVSEVILQVSLWWMLLIILALFKQVAIPKYMWLAPLTLLIMVGSQGISALDWVPTAHREPMVKRLNLDILDRESLNDFLETQKQKLKHFPEKLYLQAPRTPPLSLINTAMQKVLDQYGLVPGREVQAVKKLWGVSRALGLAYGGPAYHDVITSEVVVASQEDYPASKAWRWICVMHETAHAQGFTREMDAEILTWLALYESDDPLLQALSALMACFKSGQDFEAPQVLQNEWQEVRKAREDLHQPLVSWLKHFAKKIQLQNSGEKYGSIEKNHEIPLDHELFRALVQLSK